MNLSVVGRRSVPQSLPVCADSSVNSADLRYNGTAVGNTTSFVADNSLGGVTTVLECNSVCDKLGHRVLCLQNNHLHPSKCQT